jgi:exopolysaccharide biosynthesis protein
MKAASYLAFIKKPFAWTALYSFILVAAAVFTLLDAFVIPRAGSGGTYTPATESLAESSAESAAGTSDPVITDTSYKDGNIQITIETLRIYDTAVYIADVQVSDVKYLKTALAEDTYGRNIKETTSDMAEGMGAILAINGDYYGFRDTGFVLRDGVLYRDKSGDGDALVIGGDGNLSVVDESESDARRLCDEGAWQILSFGPALIEDSELAVTASSEVDKEMKSNPRTAIGQISSLHYIFVVSDGRTDESAGFSLVELAQVMADRGCTVAYNLDGGGSSTMWFMDEVVNVPTNGTKMGERKVSDIVYIGY